MATTIEHQRPATWNGAQFPAAGTWALDPTHTSVEFEARHLMVAKVKGRFGGVRGRARHRRGPDAVHGGGHHRRRRPSTRGVEQRDDHLKSPDFLEVDKYPEITFARHGVEHDGGGDWSSTATSPSTASPGPSRSRPSTTARPATRGAARARSSPPRPRSTARTGASPGTRRSRPAAGSSARRSRSPSRSRPCSRRTDARSGGRRGRPAGPPRAVLVSRRLRPAGGSSRGPTAGTVAAHAPPRQENAPMDPLTLYILCFAVPLIVGLAVQGWLRSTFAEEQPHAGRQRHDRRRRGPPDPGQQRPPGRAGAAVQGRPAQRPLRPALRRRLPLRARLRRPLGRGDRRGRARGRARHPARQVLRAR